MSRKVKCAVDTFPEEGLDLRKGSKVRIQNGIVMVETTMKGKTVMKVYGTAQPSAPDGQETKKRKRQRNSLELETTEDEARGGGDIQSESNDDVAIGMPDSDGSLSDVDELSVEKTAKKIKKAKKVSHINKVLKTKKSKKEKKIGKEKKPKGTPEEEDVIMHCGSGENEDATAKEKTSKRAKKPNEAEAPIEREGISMADDSSEHEDIATVEDAVINDDVLAAVMSQGMMEEESMINDLANNLAGLTGRRHKSKRTTIGDLTIEARALVEERTHIADKKAELKLLMKQHPDFIKEIGSLKGALSQLIQTFMFNKENLSRRCKGLEKAIADAQATQVTNDEDAGALPRKKSSKKNSRSTRKQQKQLKKNKADDATSTRAKGNKKGKKSTTSVQNQKAEVEISSDKALEGLSGLPKDQYKILADTIQKIKQEETAIATARVNVSGKNAELEALIQNRPDDTETIAFLQQRINGFTDNVVSRQDKLAKLRRNFDAAIAQAKVTLRSSEEQEDVSAAKGTTKKNKKRQVLRKQQKTLQKNKVPATAANRVRIGGSKKHRASNNTGLEAMASRLSLEPVKGSEMTVNAQSSEIRDPIKMEPAERRW